MNTTSPTVKEAIVGFLRAKEQARTKQTADTYKYALKRFVEPFSDDDHCPANDISEDMVIPFIKSISNLSTATQRLYLDAVVEFYKYMEGENIYPVNMARVRFIIKQRSRPRPKRLPKYPEEEIEKLLIYAESLASAPVENEMERLRNLRDRALVITLADTGLRIHEACNLNREDIDGGKAIIVGKGDKEALIRFSTHSVRVIEDYLRARTLILDGISGKPLGSLPLFARHDRAAGKKTVKRMTTSAGRLIFEVRVGECLGPDWVKKITPHKMRHRFVTEVLRQTGNLKIAKELARHENMQVTQLYAHLSDEELDNGYRKVFEK